VTKIGEAVTATTAGPTVCKHHDTSTHAIPNTNNTRHANATTIGHNDAAAAAVAATSSNVVIWRQHDGDANVGYKTAVLLACKSVGNARG